MDATIVINFLFRTIEAKLEDIGNHSIRPKMCLNSCLISFLGKLLRAFYKSYNALSFKVILQEAIQSRHAMNWMPPKYMYIVQQKYQFKRISNQTPGILATIISSKYDQNLDIKSISNANSFIPFIQSVS